MSGAGAELLLRVRDIEKELGMEGKLSLRHFAEFAAEEAHRLRARDLEHTSRGGSAMKGNLAKRRGAAQAGQVRKSQDVSGREIDVQAGTLAEVLDRQFREHALRELSQERCLTGALIA